MRVKNKGGFTPRDRRRDRKLVAIAAAVALLLFSATTAQAANTLFTIDSSLSSLGLEIKIILPAEVLGTAYEWNFGDLSTTPDWEAFNFYGGVVPPTPSPTNVTTPSGTILATFTPGGLGVGSIAFEAGSSISYATTGSYWPGPAPTFSSTLGPPFGPGYSGVPGQLGLGGGDSLNDPNYGITDSDPSTSFSVTSSAEEALADWAVIYGLMSDLGNPLTGMVDGGTPAAASVLGPGTYDPTGNGFFSGSGAIALMSIAGMFDYLIPGVPLADSLTLATEGAGGTPFPLVVGGVITFDGTTLMIPLGFTVSAPFGPGDIATIIVTTSGSIVATASPIPEPSSMILLGFGAVGLVGCAWRARKRRV